jgi:hypothetical protein
MFPPECATRRHFLKIASAFDWSRGLALSIALSEAGGKYYRSQARVFAADRHTRLDDAWMRTMVLNSVKGMSHKDLDYLLDGKANTIGALLMHLAATDRIYQINTFEGNPLRDLPSSYKERWGVAMELGETARKSIKGNGLDYYLDLISETRDTFSNFASATT